MPAGRPTKMTDNTVNKLEEAFLMGCTDEEACLFAGISKQTLYTYQDKNPEYVDRKETLKSNPVMKARQVILGALEAKDILTAHKVIDRKEGSKMALTGADGGAIKTDQSITFIPVGADG